MAQPMDGALLDGLQDHLNMERAASAAYFAMAIWSAERELKGFAHFLKSESRAEQEHAGRFADYLIARGQTVDLQDIAAPKQDWVSVEEIMAASFQMETDVTSSLQQLYTQSERVSDVRTTTFLDEVLVGQVASEHEFAHLLGRVRFAQGQPAAVLLIDQELSNGNHEPTSLT
jgi:ferritin